MALTLMPRDTPVSQGLIPAPPGSDASHLQWSGCGPVKSQPETAGSHCTKRKAQAENAIISI